MARSCIGRNLEEKRVLIRVSLTDKGKEVPPQSYINYKLHEQSKGMDS